MTESNRTDDRESVPHLNGVIRAEHDWSVLPPSTAVIQTVAIASDRDPTSLEPLCDERSRHVEADQNTCPDAEPFDELTPSQLVSLILNIDMTTGSSVPIDRHAAKVLQRAQCETIVFDGANAESIRTAVRTGEFEGTRIIPDQRNNPLSADG